MNNGFEKVIFLTDLVIMLCQKTSLSERKVMIVFEHEQYMISPHSPIVHNNSSEKTVNVAWY